MLVRKVFSPRRSKVPRPGRINHPVYLVLVYNIQLYTTYVDLNLVLKYSTSRVYTRWRCVTRYMYLYTGYSPVDGVSAH
jgi:hypothetical protein